jgi:hypothetical protein
MEDNRILIPAHPQGEVKRGDRDHDLMDRGKAVETFGGKVFVRWDADAAVTAFAPVTYFLEFLKANGLWQRWVEDCPLNYRSGNAPPKQDILGTLLLSVLAGHKRYAHVTTIRRDSVLPALLGMERVRSEDAVRRAFLKGEAAEYARWLHAHLDSSYEELLKEPWILDMDGTVKPLYGHQEQAVRGYNPTKQGRPSHVCGDPDGAGCGSAGGQSDGFHLRPAGIMGLAGSAAARAMAETGAGGYRLGNGNHAGGE